MEGLLILGGIVAAIIVWVKLHQGADAKKRLIESDKSNSALRMAVYNFERSNEQLKQYVNELENAITEKDKLYSALNNPNLAVYRIPALMADFQTLQYNISAIALRKTKRPAYKEAQRIDALKRETKQLIKSYKEIQYKFDYILSVFPELETYLDDWSTLEQLNDFGHIDNFQSTTDLTKQYLSKEEYAQLPDRIKNQRALERYINGTKSNWQIGRDYELFIGYDYAQQGWDVQYFGIEKRLDDMGRDVIAYKADITHIIQCKYWAKDKQIHEKHIAQLYGTTVQYILANKKSMQTVIPVLATNITLSKTATEFAKYLGVEVIDNKQFENFPRIKCNTTIDENGKPAKIYHLPMDQQYDTVKIIQGKSFFVETVKEAEQLGFRRAYKWRAGE